MQTDAGQNWLAQQVTRRFSRDLQTRIRIDHVRFNLFAFNKMNLDGVLVEDQNRDTLLYAGRFQVRITDWFFFKDKAELKYVGLENAQINLVRKDSVWNYAFLEDYFSSPSTGAPRKKKAGISFDLKKVEMKNVSFLQKDGWIGRNMYGKVGTLNMDANEITISNRTIDVSDVFLNEPYFAIFDYDGSRPEDYVSPATPKDTSVAAAAPEWNIRFGTVTLKNGRFRNDRDSLTPTTSYFDGAHLDFRNITGTLKNIGWTKDTVRGNISLSARERSGLEVKSLQARTTIHPKAMIFENLHLQTNKSSIGDYFAMRYNSISDMNNFIHDVMMEAHFKTAALSSDDIAFFAPDVRNWNKNIKVDGPVEGTVDALSSKDLEVWAGNNTYVHGAVSLVGLPNINETLINVEAQDLRTTYADAVSFIPAIRGITTPDLKKLSYLRFTGSYTGFINDFVTYGTIQTNLGTLRTDLNMKFPKNGEPVYLGKISTNGFQLGTFINSPSLGSVAFDGRVKGKGFTWKSLDMNIDGTVHRIEYGGYTYTNITAKGRLARRKFNGDFVMKDPNADLQLQGLIDFTGKAPLFQATANITHADLKALGLVQQDFQLSGKFDLDLQASSLSDMIGTARIGNAVLVSNGKQLAFDSLAVSSFYEDGLKKLTAVSNEFNATITGQFDLKALPDAFTVFLHRYYPSYIKAPRFTEPQVFTFDITTGVVEDYLRLIDPALTGFNNSHVTGSLNTSVNAMTVDADVPWIQYKQYQFSDVRVKGSGDLGQLTLTGELGNVQIGDSLVFPQTSFTVRAQKDVSDVTVNTTSNQAINKANLSAQVKTFGDGFSVLFNPSSFVLNGKTWTLQEGGDLNFRKNTVVHGGITLRESDQEIKLWTEPDDVGDWNDLRVAFHNVNIGDFSPFLTRAARIEGLLNGEAKVEDPEKRFDIRSTLNISALRLDDDSVGDVKANIVYNNKTGVATINANNMDVQHHFDGTVNINLKDSITNVHGQAQLSNFELKYLNRFLGVVFSDIQGYVTGKMNFDMVGADTEITAKAKVHEGKFTVDFTQVTYTLDDTEIELTKNYIDLNNLRIRDKDGNSAIVKGGIRHTGFHDMSYDIMVETQSPNFDLLNTTINDNQTFFGTAKGSGSFILVGPENDLLMEITLKASESQQSYITMPPSRTRESGEANFMVERKYGREMTPPSGAAAANLVYRVHLTANPLVTVRVILDDLTGDAIEGSGTGNLDISSGTYEPLTIRGRYDLAQGEYNYTFQSLKKFPFDLRRDGNNTITWDGDPYDAKIHLEAVYNAQNVSFAPLVNSGLFTSGLIGPGSRADVNVLATLTGNLFRPNFDFRLDFPNNNPVFNTPDFQLAIQQIEKNQNELNKQVAYLIVFNSFAPYENLTGVNPFSELTYNTISGLLFGKVNEQLNRILSKILPSNATFSFTGSLYNRDAFSQTSRGVFGLPNQSNINVGLGIPLFNERARITLGGTFDVPLAADFQTSLRLFPDVSLELLLNKSGSIKATFFYKQNVDFLSATTPGSVPRRYGASISYGREFDNIGDLLGTNKPKLAKKAADSTNVPPAADSTRTGGN